LRELACAWSAERRCAFWKRLSQAANKKRDDTKLRLLALHAPQFSGHSSQLAACENASHAREKEKMKDENGYLKIESVLEAKPAS
jgi:hypothetical protein